MIAVGGSAGTSFKSHNFSLPVRTEGHHHVMSLEGVHT